jgi:hypothetical protein
MVHVGADVRRVLVLAQADEGLTCFFMPRFKPDGSVNALQFSASDKLGNRSTHLLSGIRRYLRRESACR